MARFNREDARTVLPQLEKNIDALVERVDALKMFQTEFETKHVISEKADMTEVNIKNMNIVLNDCTITDSGTALSVTAGANTEDGQLAQAVIDAFDYATAKEILEV